MNKNTIIAIIVLGILALAGVWWFQSSKGPSPASEQPSDTTGAILQDADALDLGDLDKEFQDIDRDLQTL